jgi:hypothetical protein
MYSKFITHLENWRCVISLIFYSDCTEKMVMFHFVAVKMVHKSVLDSTSNFWCPICIYVYHSCMHKLHPLIQIPNSLLPAFPSFHPLELLVTNFTDLSLFLFEVPFHSFPSSYPLLFQYIILMKKKKSLSKLCHKHFPSTPPPTQTLGGNICVSFSYPLPKNSLSAVTNTSSQ